MESGRPAAAGQREPVARPAAPGGEQGRRDGAEAARALEKSPQLASRVGEMLPPGTDVQGAAAGFGNLGEFLSAVHVSRNLGIPFESLKGEILKGSSLGEAVRALKPDLSGDELRREIRRANQMAKDELRKDRERRTQRDRDRIQSRTEGRRGPGEPR